MKQLRPYQLNVLNQLKQRLKETESPLLVNASVGAGKSLIIAELLKVIEKAGWRALCLTMNSTLIRQNAETYQLQGGGCGIYCAALGRKDCDEPIIFASPLSVRGSIKAKGKLSKVHFNLIVVDECHNINFAEKDTTYMRIFTHYAMLAQTEQYKLRFVGLTGTPFRGKGHSIVGENLFFKEEVCAITADWLIENQYLTTPVWGYCEKTLQYDFHELKVNAMGKFSSIELESCVNKTPRLTAKIMAEVTEIVKDRKGAFIFATSIQHCHECAEWLPPEQTAIITGDTPDKLRDEYITKARAGVIKYLVNVNVLCTGVDVPTFDTVVFVRPTESLVLYVQCLGRGLRLADGKTDCLILDYAGNLDRHGDIDNPIINKALTQDREGDPDYCVQCYNCDSMNTVTARRCIGSKEGSRCDHWFEWKDCPACQAKNDIVSRQCRLCFTELIDPNKNLKEIASNKNRILLDVKETQYSLSIINGSPRFDILYVLNPKTNPTDYIKAQENFLLSSEKAIRFFYHTVVKLHFFHPHQAYARLNNIAYLKSVLENNELHSPAQIDCIEVDRGRLKVVEKYFDHPTVLEDERELDVIYTFVELTKLNSQVIFEYLVKENNQLRLIRDQYKVRTSSSYSRFVKNYGATLGDDIDKVASNQGDIRFPTKIWVDQKDKMKRFSENGNLITWQDNWNAVLSRTGLRAAYDKWCEIIKFTVFNQTISYDKNKKSFKVFRVQIYGFVKAMNDWGEEFETIVDVSCKLHHADLDRLHNKEFRAFQVIADGRHAEDISKWQTFEGKEFEKLNCFNWLD